MSPPPFLRNAFAALFGLAGAHIWTKAVSHLAITNVLRPRLARKLSHITTAPFFILTFPLYSNSVYSRYLAALVPLSFALRIVRNPSKDKLAVAVARQKGEEGSPVHEARGLAAYAAAVGTITALGWRGDVATYISISAMAFGDGAADLIGNAVNGPKLPLPPKFFVKKKTLAGTIAFIAATLVGGKGMVSMAKGLGMVGRDVAWGGIMKVAVAAAAVELFPMEDNFSVPLSAFLVARKVFGGF